MSFSNVVSDLLVIKHQTMISMPNADGLPNVLTDITNTWIFPDSINRHISVLHEEVICSDVYGRVF